MGEGDSAAEGLLLCVVLWAVSGREVELAAYEDSVLGLLGDHGARLVSRVRGVEPGDGPYEVQVIALPGQAALDSYLADPRRLALADARDRSVARTEIVRVAPVAVDGAGDGLEGRSV